MGFFGRIAKAVASAIDAVDRAVSTVLEIPRERRAKRTQKREEPKPAPKPAPRAPEPAKPPKRSVAERRADLAARLGPIDESEEIPTEELELEQWLLYFEEREAMGDAPDGFSDFIRATVEGDDIALDDEIFSELEYEDPDGTSGTNGEAAT